MTAQTILMSGLASAGALLIFAYFLGRDNRGGRYVERMAEVEDHPMASSLEEIEMARPLSQRVLVPLRDRIFAAVSSRTPAARQRELRVLIQNAGRPMHATVAAVMVAKIGLAAALAAVVAFVFLPFVHVAFPLSLLGLAAGLVGWILPEQWLKQRARARRAELEKVIPDTLDLLTICLDAGLAFDAALNELAAKVQGVMAEELNATLAEIRLGRPRSEALEEMAKRVDVDDWTDFVQAIVLSRKLGAAISETVRVQSAEIRRRRRQRAEEKAAQASLKMLFPMIGCIFPTLFIVLMGPVALLLLAPK